MNKRIDLSDIKESDLDKTSSFTDLMSRRERRNKKQDDIEDMLEEKRKSTKDLTQELEKAQKEYKRSMDDNEDSLAKTQILELTRQMKFNFNENKEENLEKKKKGVSPLNIIGEINLLCIGFYIYLLLFTSYQDSENTYMITGGIIVLLVLLFGISVVSNKKVSNIFKVLNIITILGFIGFNVYSILY